MYIKTIGFLFSVADFYICKKMQLKNSNEDFKFVNFLYLIEMVLLIFQKLLTSIRNILTRERIHSELNELVTLLGRRFIRLLKKQILLFLDAEKQKELVFTFGSKDLMSFLEITKSTTSRFIKKLCNSELITKKQKGYSISFWSIIYFIQIILYFEQIKCYCRKLIIPELLDDGYNLCCRKIIINLENGNNDLICNQTDEIDYIDFFDIVFKKIVVVLLCVLKKYIEFFIFLAKNAKSPFNGKISLKTRRISEFTKIDFRNLKDYLKILENFGFIQRKFNENSKAKNIYLRKKTIDLFLLYYLQTLDEVCSECNGFVQTQIENYDVMIKRCTKCNSELFNSQLSKISFSSIFIDDDSKSQILVKNFNLYLFNNSLL